MLSRWILKMIGGLLYDEKCYITCRENALIRAYLSSSMNNTQLSKMPGA